LIILFFQYKGFRLIESIVASLIFVILACFTYEIIASHPDFIPIVSGLLPRQQIIFNPTMLYIAIGILGATVMPHNLYLHSSLVQTRKFNRTHQGIKEAIKFNFIDTFISLNLALFVNAAILILAAAAFFSNGVTSVVEIQDAHKLLSDVLGNSLAPALFAIALIAAGQSSTLTGTLSGQIVMEGYLNLRIQPWLRRIITRLIAIIPALITILILGEGATGKLLILSQVVLSLQLGFAVIPLIHLTSDKKTMGEFVNKLWLKICAWLIASLIIILNAKLVIETIHEWIQKSAHPVFIYFTIIPLAIGAGLLLLYVTFMPFIKRAKESAIHSLDGTAKEFKQFTEEHYHRIAVSVDFSISDHKAVNSAIALGGKNAEYILIHIVETAGARMMDSEIVDFETMSDKRNLELYKTDLEAKGYKVHTKLGFGNPKKSIPKLVNASNCDLLVMGAHGHTGFKDIIFGTTLDAVRHHVKASVLIV